MIGIIIVLAFFVWLIFFYLTKKKKKVNTSPYFEEVLEKEIEFYQKIKDPLLKQAFKRRVINLVEHTVFTDVGEAKHTEHDKVLIGVSAYIPIVNFPEWEYHNLKEVLLYEDNFNHQFQVDDENHIMGMVGEGAYNNTMLLSLTALRDGFDHRDGSHTAIHEFVHLLDKADGATDGVPEILIPDNMITPWLQLIRHTMEDIKNNETNLNTYAATNEAEFLAVMAEYFFEKPGMLSEQHPVLYAMLKKIFQPTEDS